jgi:hypothetical protein
MPCTDYFVIAAHVGTSSAGNAAAAVKHYLRASFLGFGIMAPSTAQGTSLQKHRRSDPRAVVYAKTLYIKYRSHHDHLNYHDFITLPPKSKSQQTKFAHSTPRFTICVDYSLPKCYNLFNTLTEVYQ